MPAATVFHIGINHQGRLAVTFRSTHSGATVERVIRTYEQLADFLRSKANEAKPEEIRVLSSSTLDFPSEWTKDETVIALAQRIQGNSKEAR